MNSLLEFQLNLSKLLNESQYWSVDKMMAYQFSQLNVLLKHSFDNVPFYKDRLSPIVLSDGNFDFSKWKNIPIVKRKDLLEKKSEMLAKSLPKNCGPVREVFSAGSTGTPICTSHNSLSGIISEIVVHRSHRWNNLDVSQNCLTWMGNDESVATWPNGKENKSWAPIDAPIQGKNFTLNRATKLDKLVEFISRNKIKHLSGRPRSIQSIALFVEHSGLDIKLESVILSGALISDDIRTDIQRVFGSKIIEYYSSGEGYKMAISCENERQLHVNSEIVFFEILDDKDNPCPIGVPGRVVITPFFNFSQPLIRYEHGDIASWGSPCSCGITLPTIKKIIGRTTDLFKFPNVAPLAPFLPDKIFNSGFGSSRWQLAQVGPLEVELRYIRTDGNVNKEFATDIINKKIHPDINVKIRELDKNSHRDNDKFIQYVCEI